MLLLSHLHCLSAGELDNVTVRFCAYAWLCPLHVVPQLQKCKADLDSSLPPPLDSVVVWLQRAEAALAEDGGKEKDHTDAAKDARAQQDTLKVLSRANLIFS